MHIQVAQLPLDSRIPSQTAGTDYGTVYPVNGLQNTTIREGITDMATRSLTSKETTAAFGVFQLSINYSKVRVRDDLGIGGSPWTSPPGPGNSNYVLHVGPTLYQDLAKNNSRKVVLIHELTHVWQGQHGVPLGYVLNSALHQSIAAITNGGKVAKAYDYTPGGKWALYNCEQQATIVDDWFQAGSSSSHHLYTYITKNIRPGNPWA